MWGTAYAIGSRDSRVDISSDIIGMMHLAILALHGLMQVAVPPPQRRTTVRDSLVGDTTRRAPIRRPVTPALLASAFHDADARDLFTRARDARVAQDSSIRSYDAKVRQRMSVTAAIGSVPLEKLVYRQEGAARVRWQRGIGAHIEVTAGRVTIPPVGMPSVDRDALESMVADVDQVPIPYFPGNEPLWVGTFAATPEVNENSVVNPLADGAEAYYTYRSGDSLSIRVGDGPTIRVRQVDFRPRAAEWNVVIGSLWIDRESGHLVRAAYRMASPGGAAISVQSKSGKENTILRTVIKSLMPTTSAQISAIVIEYQRYDGFWLPSMQTMQGFAKASFARVPVTIENNFSYQSVNAPSDLPSIHVDSVRKDTTRGKQRRGSILQCDTATTRTVTAYKGGGQVPIEMRIPCNLDSLMNSPDLPRSAFDKGEAIFGSRDADQLIADALSMSDQAPINLGALPHPRYQYGLSMTRYNRIEGFSTGLRFEQPLGGGLDVTGEGRIGTADHEPRFDLSLGRSNLSKTIRLGGYNRLVSASDWENPLTFGSSLGAFFFGRDDAFYYRASGGELRWTSDRGLRLDWRAFRERQSTAVPKTDFSVGGSFLPNIEATNGVYTGASVRLQLSHGLDPRGFRVSTDMHLEGAQGDSTYGRGSVDMTLSRGFGEAFDGALTIAGGSSVGEVPVQRRWFLGGTQTVRGQRPDTAQSGNAFWLGRLELGRTVNWLRPSLFGDLGWAGDRTKMSDVGRPLSGVGVGFSFLDGAIRLDLARGLYPREQTRLSLYLGARF